MPDPGVDAASSSVRGAFRLLQPLGWLGMGAAIYAPLASRTSSSQHPNGRITQLRNPRPIVILSVPVKDRCRFQNRIINAAKACG